MICLSYCKIEIEEVDDFEEFEESPRNDADLKFKEDLSPVVDKTEAEVTIEVFLNQKLIDSSIFIYWFFY